MPHRSIDQSAMRPASVRLQNAALVLHCLADGSPASRSELAVRTSLTPQALGSILTTLVNDGLVVEEVRETSTPGRPPTEYSLDPTGSLSVGVLVRQGDYYLLIDDALGRRVTTQRIRFAPDRVAEPLLRSIVATLERAIDELELELARVHTIELAVQGTIGEHHRVVGTATAWPDRDVDVAEIIETAIGRPIDVIVTSIERAQARHALEQTEHEPNELIAIVHVGLESRLILARGGELVTNRLGDGGLATHLRVAGNNRQCDCGQFGCLGTVSSGTAVVAHYREVTGTVLSAPTDIIDLVGQGDPDAIEAARRSIEWFARGIAPLLRVIRPDRIICTGGGVGRADSRGAQRLVDTLRAHLDGDLDHVGIEIVPPPFLTGGPHSTRA